MGGYNFEYGYLFKNISNLSLAFDALSPLGNLCRVSQFFNLAVELKSIWTSRFFWGLIFLIMKISREKFEKWTAEAVDALPGRFQEKINNLVFFVEDYPTGEQLKKAKLSGRRDVVLLGLYEGYHQSKRLDVGPVLPDRITIFKRPIESICATEEEVKRQVEQTVRHEVAHHFGSDETGARKVG